VPVEAFLPLFLNKQLGFCSRLLVGCMWDIRLVFSIVFNLPPPIWNHFSQFSVVRSVTPSVNSISRCETGYERFEFTHQDCCCSVRRGRRRHLRMGISPSERELELVRRYAGRLLKKYLFETNSPKKFLSPSLYVQYNQCKKSIVYRVVTIMSFLASDF